MQTLSAWATVVLAAVAVLAYFAARGQIREARQLRKASHRAYVVVHAEGDKPTRAIYLVLENTGQTVAKNASVTFTPPLQAAHPAVDLAGSTRVWDQPTIPPGKSVRTVLDRGPERLDSDLPMAYEARVTYDSPATEESKITDTYRIDLRSSAYGVREWDLVDDNPRRQTAALEKIANSLDK